MALKLQIKKAAFDKLDEGVQALYKASPDNGEIFLLDVDGVEDPAPELRRAKERSDQRLTELEAQLETFKTAEAEKIAAAEAKALAKAREDGNIDQLEAKWQSDIKALETSWQTKHEAALAEKDAQIGKLNSFADNTLRNSVADAIASQISTVPTLMKRALLDRLTVDHSGETPVTKVLDENGQPSALTIDDLKKSFVDNKEFSAIIKGSNANGGAAPTDKIPGSPGATQNPPQQTTLARMPAKDLRAQIAAKADAR